MNKSGKDRLKEIRKARRAKFRINHMGECVKCEVKFQIRSGYIVSLCYGRLDLVR